MTKMKHRDLDSEVVELVDRIKESKMEEARAMSSALKTIPIGSVKTKLVLQVPGKLSLRTTVPLMVRKELGLKLGDEIEWSVMSLDGKKGAWVKLAR